MGSPSMGTNTGKKAELLLPLHPHLGTWEKPRQDFILVGTKWKLGPEKESQV